MTKKNLTVAITTYNRKDYLLKALRSFEVQGQFDQYKILISNNDSNYNVNEWLEQNLTNDFFDIISIYNRPYNVGGDINISFTFQLCDTKWMWLMSDDDIAMPNSLKIVLSNINKFPDVAHIKYSVQGFKSLPDKICNSLEEVLDVFSNKNLENANGLFIFMSNNVINLDQVKEYIGIAPYYASTCITQLIPSIYALYKNNYAWKISSECITNYFAENILYQPIYAIVNITNIQLIDADFTDEIIFKIRSLFILGSRKDMTNMLLKINSKERRLLLFYRIWHGYYSISSLNGWVFYAYFLLRNFYTNLKYISNRNKKN